MNFVFTKDMGLVQDGVFLIMTGVYKSVEELPNLGNFRQVVQEVLDEKMKKVLSN